MDELPNELLIEIFAYLKFKDLCQLTLTCKSFNEIISNSSILMDEFRLINRRTDSEKIDFLMRTKYRIIEIKSVDKSLMKFLECNGKNIFDIKMQSKIIEMRNLRRILTFCPNVKHLNINTDKFKYSNDDLTEPVIKLTLDSLTINYIDSNFFKILQVSAKIIRVDTKYLNSTIKDPLLDLLRSQQQLKTLELVPYCFQLFVDDSLTNVDFQLESFATDCFYLPDSSHKHFKKFLKNQKSLVRIIEENISRVSTNCNYANILRDCENIKELKVPGPFDFFHPLPHIEKLTIDDVCYAKTNRNIDKLFPNVKNLCIKSFYKIKFVENIAEFVYFSIDNVKFKISENVKKLTVKNVKFGSDCLFDDDVDIKIDSLSIYKVDNIDWLIDCFNNNRMKLKSLTIEGTKMNKSQEEFLESLTRGENKKIEKLKIYMPMKLNENHDYVCDYQMENESGDAKRIKLK